jgi:hypothetical protein
MDIDRREGVFDQQLVQDLGTRNTLDKHNALVELKSIQKLEQFAVLFVFRKLDIVLLETVKGDLGTIVDQDFKRLQVVHQQ